LPDKLEFVGIVQPKIDALCDPKKGSEEEEKGENQSQGLN